MRSTRRRIVALVAIAAITGAAWYVLRSTRPALSQHSKSPIKTPAVLELTSPAVRPMRSAGRRAVIPEKSTDPSSQEFVVCGIGKVRVSASERAAPFYYVDHVTADSQQRWRQALLGSDDHRAHAAGLLLISAGWERDSITGMPTRTHEAVLARDELVQLAAGLDDLPVYAMAIRACDQSYEEGPRDAACDRLSLTKWAQMDSDNAAPWMQLAAAAHARSDSASEFDAIDHATHSHKIDFYNDAILEYAGSSMPPGTNELERAAFFSSHIGHRGGDGLAHAFVTDRYCTDEAIQKSSVRQQCEALAELLAGHARNSLDLSAAQQLGVRLAWTSERLTSIQQEMLAAFRVDPPSNENPWNCDNVRAVNEFASIQGRSGELAAARAAIRKSGKTIAELAQEQIDSVQKQFEQECTKAGRTVVASASGGAMC